MWLMPTAMFTTEWPSEHDYKKDALRFHTFCCTDGTEIVSKVIVTENLLNSQTSKIFRSPFYVHVTVHRDKFPCNKTN
jgi:hypothetical protein